MKNAILFCLFFLIVIVTIVLEIYVWVTYGQTSLDEIPTWVLFFMFKWWIVINYSGLKN